MNEGSKIERLKIERSKIIGGNMQDLIFTILTVLFFAASVAYVYACERLR